MVELIQFVLNGLMAGSIYALIAVGLVAVYKSTHVVNFAHGYMIMFAAYLYYTFAVLVPDASWAPAWLAAWQPDWLMALKTDVSPFSTVGAFLTWVSALPRILFGLIFAIIGACAVSLAVERFLLRPLLGQSNFSMIMVTIGLISVLSGLKSVFWTGDAANVPHLTPNPAFRIALFDSNIFIFGANFFSMLLAALLFGGIIWWLRSSAAGVAIRAAAQDQGTAYSMGINVPKVFAQAWVIAAVTGAIAGMVIGARDGVSPYIGLYGFSVLAIVLMGGLDSFLGVFIAALFVGVVEALVQWQLGGHWVEITPYVLVLIVILIRPHGFLGQAEVERI